MFFLNLSLPEFLAILGSLSGVVVALYLLDRMRKHHTVATLRFFAAAEKPPVLKHRRKLQQPWSLAAAIDQPAAAACWPSHSFASARRRVTRAITC